MKNKLMVLVMEINCNNRDLYILSVLVILVVISKNRVTDIWCYLFLFNHVIYKKIQNFSRNTNADKLDQLIKTIPILVIPY